MKHGQKSAVMPREHYASRLLKRSAVSNKKNSAKWKNLESRGISRLVNET
jgi:hypothetical protein